MRCRAGAGSIVFKPGARAPIDAKLEETMADQPEATPARFRWYELQTTDSAAAEAFYRAVVGWSAERLGEPPQGYTVLSTAKGGVGGIMTLPPDQGAPGWIGYIAVNDVDAAVERIVAAGGKVRQPPTDVPGMLRFSGVADPQGAPFTVFKGTSPEGPPEGGRGETGYVGWCELMAEDGAKAFDFYASQFGWTRTSGFDMGPMGLYQLWTDGRDGDAGGMMTRPPGAPGPKWNFYFRVEGIDAGAERIKAAGGTVVNGPHQVPSNDWIVQALDPQGIAFCLLSAVK